MRVAVQPIPTCRPSRRAKSNETSTGTPSFAATEINAYIAIRDGLLAEAEQTHSREKIESTLVANDFVASCLKPARTPYQAQAYPEADALRERKRCQAVSARVTELRAVIA